MKDTSHQYTFPATKVKVICKAQGQISGSCFSKDRCFGGISVSQTHLVSLTLYQTTNFRPTAFADNKINVT